MELVYTADLKSAAVRIVGSSPTARIMKPQKQRYTCGPVFDEQGQQTDIGGDCFAACIASILEIPIEGFPNFLAKIGDKTWWERWLDYLYAEYRSTLIFWEDDLPDVKQLAWWIAEVQDGPTPHSVIFYQDQFRFDPWPGATRQWKMSDIVSVVAIYSVASVFEQS